MWQRIDHWSKRVKQQLRGRRADWWLGGWGLALIVKFLGLRFGGVISLLGLILLSAWLPGLAEVSGPRRWTGRQRFRVWGQSLLIALIWLPLGWGGYVATLQVSVRLPASFQDVLFNTRYEWLPVLIPVWTVIWLLSLRWLPAWRQTLRAPISWRRFWQIGWSTAWWAVVKRGSRLLVWLLGWCALAGILATLVWFGEMLQPTVGAGLAILSLVVLQATVWMGVMGWWSRYWPAPVSDPTLARLGTVLLGLGLIGYAAWWFYPVNTSLPAVIAHRGVNGRDGVQNTTTALTRTVKATRPALVEMDIQPTADHHWVVMHDPTLEALAKRPGPVKRYRLEQLAGLPLSEHGQSGRLSTFTGYLHVANQLQQPLLVEVKALGGAPELMGAFSDHYAPTLIRQGGAVHSLNYQVIERLAQRNNRLRIGYITPFYLTNFSHSVAKFYSLQALTATREQVNALHRDQRTCYFWTVDRPASMQRLSAMGADGLITNRPGRLRQQQAGRTHYYFYQLSNWLLSWL